MNGLFTKCVTGITRSEGKKFLNLHSGLDESILEKSDTVKQGYTSLYIHIPFCHTLCPFCCFNRYLFKESIARKYFSNLKRELSLYIKHGFQFSDFYFGGGTPTILMDELSSFIDFLKENFEVKRISLETTPKEINKENIDWLTKLHIDRLSIGVQSFDDSVVKSIGRVQCSGEEAKERVIMAQGKFDTVNVDLVFNLPSQSVAQFEKDVSIFKELGIDQATFYPLMASPHKKDAMERKFNRVDNSREQKFYDVILRELYDAGYEPSTAWCFSRSKKMIDEYIIDFDDYIGIGAGSVSIYRGNFLVNTFSLDKYDAMVNADKFPVAGWRRLSNREQMYYYLLTKLFGIQFKTNKFKERFGTDIDQRLGMEIMAFRLFNVIKGSENVTVTRNGMYPVSSMMREFFTSLNTLRELYIEKQI